MPFESSWCKYNILIFYFFIIFFLPSSRRELSTVVHRVVHRNFLKASPGFFHTSSEPKPHIKSIFSFPAQLQGSWKMLLMTLFCCHGKTGMTWNMHNLIRMLRSFKNLDNEFNFEQNRKRTHDYQSYCWITEQLWLRLTGITPVALSLSSWILT